MLLNGYNQAGKQIKMELFRGFDYFNAKYRISVGAFDRGCSNIRPSKGWEVGDHRIRRVCEGVYIISEESAELMTQPILKNFT